MLEGRKQARIATRVLVHMSAVHDPRVADVGSIEDLSSHGARVATQRSWELGLHVDIKTLSGDMKARARIVYCQSLESQRFAVGLDFLTQFRVGPRAN